MIERGPRDRRAAPRRRPRFRHVRAAWAARLPDARRGCSTCRCRASTGAIRSTMPAPPSPPPSLVFGDALTTRALEHGLTHAEWPARLERPRRRRPPCLCRRRHRDLARRRPQCRRRPGHRACACRARRARAAPGASHLRHDGDQGRARLHRAVQGARRARLHRADPRRAERLRAPRPWPRSPRPKASSGADRERARRADAVAGGARRALAAC